MAKNWDAARTINPTVAEAIAMVRVWSKPVFHAVEHSKVHPPWVDGNPEALQHDVATGSGHPRDIRSDAMAMAKKWSEVTSDLAPGKTHPVNVMAAYNKLDAPPKVEKWAELTHGGSSTLGLRSRESR